MLELVEVSILAEELLEAQVLMKVEVLFLVQVEELFQVQVSCLVQVLVVAWYQEYRQEHNLHLYHNSKVVLHL